MFHILICPLPGKMEADALGPAWPPSTRAYGVCTPQVPGSPHRSLPPSPVHPGEDWRCCAAPLPPAGLDGVVSAEGHRKWRRGANAGTIQQESKPAQDRTFHVKQEECRMQIGGRAWDGNGNLGKGERGTEAGARRDWQNFLSQGVICICFSPSSSRFGLEKVVWRVLGLKSCSQKADDYLKNSVCLTLATSVPLFHLLFFKSIPFT